MGWIIDKDKIASEQDKADNPDGKSNLHAIGLVGPRSISKKCEAALQAGEGIKFKMYDDDGELYYIGRYLEDPELAEGVWEDEFQPLDNFGSPNAGCTMIKYRSPETKKWELL